MEEEVRLDQVMKEKAGLNTLPFFSFNLNMTDCNLPSLPGLMVSTGFDPPALTL